MESDELGNDLKMEIKIEEAFDTGMEELEWFNNSSIEGSVSNGYSPPRSEANQYDMEMEDLRGVLGFAM